MEGRPLGTRLGGEAYTKGLADDVSARVPWRHRSFGVRLVLAHVVIAGQEKIKKGSRWKKKLEIKERNKCAITLRRGICSAIRGCRRR